MITFTHAESNTVEKFGGSLQILNYFQDQILHHIFSKYFHFKKILNSQIVHRQAFHLKTSLTYQIVIVIFRYDYTCQIPCIKNQGNEYCVKNRKVF